MYYQYENLTLENNQEESEEKKRPDYYSHENSRGGNLLKRIEYNAKNVINVLKMGFIYF